MTSVQLVVFTQAQSNKFVPYHRIFGTGDPILIINGGPGMNSNGFAGVAQKIANMGYQTIIFDQRGTGNSKLASINSQTITMDLMVDDIEQLRRELKIDKWTILGHSFGGLLACAYYAKYSSSVQKLVFSSSGGVNLNFLNYVNDNIQSNLTQTQRDSLNYYQNKISNGDTSIKTLRKRADFLANAYLFDKEFKDIIADRLLEVNFTINNLVFRDLMNSKFDYTNHFRDQDIPVLILQGTNDIINMQSALEIRNSFGNAKIVELIDCAHYGWLDNPIEFFEILLDFLKE